ncbi:MAG: glycosyltransferase [Gaiella sp.]
MTTATLRLAVVTVLGGGIAVSELVARGETEIRTQVICQLVAFAFFLPAAWLCWRGLGAGRTGVALVVVVAVVLNAVAFDWSAPPPLTTDTYRYAWDARVQAAGINPYRYAPDAEALRSLRDAEIWPRINRKSWPTVYPPGAEASFFGARLLFGNGVRATTWLFLAAMGLSVLLLIGLLRRIGAPPERVVLLAWHPLAINEIAANGHADALVVLACCAILALWARERRGLAGFATGAAALFKLGPVLLVAALARGGSRRFVLAALGTIGAGYAAYASAGTRVTGSVFRYLDEDLGSLAWYLLRLPIGRELAQLVLAGIVLAVAAFVSLRAHDTVDQVARSGLVVLGAMLLGAAYLQPWYALWLLPFLVVTPGPAWLWLTGTLPLLYVFGIEQSLPVWIRVAIYGPFLLLCVLRLTRVRGDDVMALRPLPEHARVAVVIPVIDEAEALPGVLASIPHHLVDEIVVVDGGSTDGTVQLARDAGARVVEEPRRGYGRACLAGAAATTAEIVVWMDGDGSDDPRVLEALLTPVRNGSAALALGIRTSLEPGAQHWHQRAGNRLVSLGIRVATGVAVKDIPPFRVIRRDALDGLELREMTYGWPTEMVVKAARDGLPIAQVGVPSRARRGGRSKVSGRLGPSLRAGTRMLGVVARHG